jgi:hypothetical protein
MRSNKIRDRKVVQTSALFFAIVSMIYVVFNHAGSEKVEDEYSRMEKIFENYKTVCFGRFLINVPASATVVYGPAEVAVPIEKMAEDADELGQVLKNRLAEIDSQREFAFGELLSKDSQLGIVTDGQRVGQKIIFGVRQSTGDDYRIDSYLVDKNKIFLTWIFSSADKASYLKAVNKLNGISKLISARSDLEIPSSQGVCIDGGFVAESNELKHESIALGVRLREFPDIHFSVTTTKKSSLVESDAIEPRLLLAEQEAKRSGHESWYSRIMIFRRGEAKIGNWKGYEILARKPPQADQKESYEFSFLSQGEPNNSYLPVLDVKLHSGVLDNKIGRIKTSASDEEMLAIWDRLTQSIRQRPVK